MRLAATGLRLLCILACLFAGIPAGADEAQTEYAVGERDVLAIRVFDEPDLSGEMVVDRQGAINYPLLGRIRVAGRTPAQIESLLQRALASRFLVDPQVFVTLKEYNSRRAVVLGMVKNPGPYSLTGSATILDLVSRAGGVLEGAGRNLVLIRGGNLPAAERVTGETAPVLVDSNRLLKEGDRSLNISVGHGDIIFAPRSDGVYVYGQVKRPGIVPWRDGLTILQAISLAEGLTNQAAESKVQIVRKSGSREQKLRVRLDDVVGGKASDLQLRPEDVIIVPESFL